MIKEKACTKCGVRKPLEAFSRDSRNKDGRRSHCKVCRAAANAAWRAANPERAAAATAAWAKNNPEKNRAKVAKRRAVKLQRTPAWADHEKINLVYDVCLEGYEVDHIIPFQGRLVSGLHVAENLQYLTPAENRSKGNRFNWKEFNGFTKSRRR